MDAMTTHNDYRALCAEMIFCWSRTTNPEDFSENAAPIIERMRAALAQSEPSQDDATLRSIRETTPRYRMSVIVSTHDSAIDTRMPVIWSALDWDKEILESVSLPEQLPPLGN